MTPSPDPSFALRAANEQLTLMALRSQELAEDAEEARRKLEVSEGELRILGEFRDRLIGIVSHDLRNPLGAISISLDVLERNLHLDAKGHATAAKIRRSSDRMSEMIAQLLDFTRAHTETGIPIQPTATDLEKVCREVLDELELKHSMVGRFSYHFSGDLHGTWDAHRLGQVISNLGANAIQYGAPSTPIDLTITGEAGEVLIEMHNQGPPISADLQPFIFDPFLRASDKGQSGSGLGLGLHISDEIVRGHGGSLTVRSAAGEGTTFSVRLPRLSVNPRPSISAPPRGH